MQGIFITELSPAGDGIRLAVKDLFETAGVRTTYGSAIFAEHVSQRTAEAVCRLEAAGYVSVGKANLHEFAWGITSENEHFGWVPNPIAPGRIPGGSSGGCAAALVAGLADAAVGTDSGGSVRIPAACCGIVGFKPTFASVPIDGCFPLAPSFDHVGPMARDVETCERMMEALAEDFAPAAAPDLRELAVGVAWTADADPLVRRRVEAVAALLPGARQVELALARDTEAVFLREAAEVHESLWSEHSELYGANVAAKVRRAIGVGDAAVGEARRARERHRQRFAELMEDLDLLITPTLVTVAPPAGIGDLVLREKLIRLTYPFNVLGVPALAMPCGSAEDGLPASVQIVGRPGDDALVLASGRAIEVVLRSVTRAQARARWGGPWRSGPGGRWRRSSQ